MEDNHKTSKPIIMAIVTAAVFVFTSLVFICYDLMVARRQKIVMNRALESGAIVSSLFPQEVCDKLYEENKQKFERANTFKNQESAVAPGNQIASLYPETTIFCTYHLVAYNAVRRPIQILIFCFC